MCSQDLCHRWYSKALVVAIKRNEYMFDTSWTLQHIAIIYAYLCIESGSRGSGGPGGSSDAFRSWQTLFKKKKRKKKKKEVKKKNKKKTIEAFELATNIVPRISIRSSWSRLPGITLETNNYNYLTNEYNKKKGIKLTGGPGLPGEPTGPV